MSQKINVCMHPVKKCFLNDGNMSFEIKDCLGKDCCTTDRTITFEINEKENEKSKQHVQSCTCCRPMDFPTAESKRLYEQAAKKGRRGVVLSLEIDQTTSYVTTLASEEHLKFRFQMPNSKQVR